MRSFTKKNYSYNESLYRLLFENDGAKGDLRTFFEGQEMKEASEQMINLTNSAALSSLIDDEERGKLRRTYRSLNDQVISGFGGGFGVNNFTNPANGNFQGARQNAGDNFPSVDVAGEVDNNLGNRASLISSLRNNAPQPNNRIDIETAPQNGAAVVLPTIQNIATLLRLKELLKYAKQRAYYENLYSFRIRGTDALQNQQEAHRINQFIFFPQENPQTLLGDFGRDRSQLNQILATGDVFGTSATLNRIINQISHMSIEGVFFWNRHDMGPVTSDHGIVVPFQQAKRLIGHFIDGLTVDFSNDVAGYNGLNINGKEEVLHQIRLINFLQMNYKKGLDVLLARPTLGRGYEKYYGYSKQPLVSCQGLYCGFCESSLVDGRSADIEHKLPKSVFPTEAANWENFVMACKICNSDFKSEKIVDHTHQVNDGVGYTVNTFTPAGGAGKDYLAYLENSKSETTWPDMRHPVVGGLAAHNVLSFQIFEYSLYSAGDPRPPLDIQLPNIGLKSSISVSLTNNRYSVDLSGLVPSLGINNSQNDVRIECSTRGGMPANINGVGVDASRSNITNICGLNEAGATVATWHNDQRAVRRTKAWLNAMKQLKILKDFQTNFRELTTYYERQLNPVAIQNNLGANGDPNRNFIKKLRDLGTGVVGQAATVDPIDISLRRVRGTITINSVIGDRFVNQNIDGATTSLEILPFVGGHNPRTPNIDRGTLLGNIVLNGAQRLATGTIIVGNSPGQDNYINNKIISFKDIPITDIQANPTVLTLLENQTTITQDAQADVANSPAGIVKEWEEKRNKLLNHLDKADTLLKSFIWENTLNMVKDGGFYSTWVRTFQRECSRQNWAPPNNPRYDVDLVRRLEMEAVSQPNDPFQFHGTDAAEIIESLG